jgi:hypothetical protein
MQKFYINKNNQQEGPFSLDELKDLKITRDTMVWFEGKENWLKAIEVVELKEIFKSIPPPIFEKSTLATPPSIDYKLKEENTPLVELKSNKKNKSLIIVIVAVFLIGSLGAYVYVNQQAKQAEIQKQLDEQKTKIQEQEKIEAERLAEEQRKQRAADMEQRKEELESLKYEYDQAVIDLEAANIRLGEIKQFKLLRTALEKKQQIQEQLETIRSLENEVNRLQEEISKY